MLISAALLSMLLDGSVAAPVPPSPPLPDKPPPSSWKLADLNALLPNSEDAGPVAILVWEAIDSEGINPTLERCLIVKKYVKPADGAAYALGYLKRRPTEKDADWKPSSVISARRDRSGKAVNEKIVGIKSYKCLPSNEEIATFLKERIWASETEEWSGSRVEVGKPKFEYTVTPKVTNGGVCRAEWKKVFGREPLAKLFPELTPPAEKK